MPACRGPSASTIPVFPGSLLDWTLSPLEKRIRSSWHDEPSILPVHVRQRRAIQLIPVLPPLRHEAIHVPLEPVVMPALDEVNQFVQHDVLKALARLLG